MQNKKILIIAFKYPPYAGVGAFRWTKICKYLARLGYKIHIVTVDWEYFGQNTNIADTKHENIIIHRLPSGYPLKLRYIKIQNRYLNLLRNILFLKFVNRLFYWDDEAQRWGKYLLPFAERLIKTEEVTCIIATGHPFQSNYWAAQLKKRCPAVKLIQDFRDPWVQHPLYRRLHNKKVIRKAEGYMHESLKYADLCVCVTKGLVEEYKKYNNTQRYAVITNGYDEETVQRINSSSIRLNKQTKKIYITHIGNVSNGRDYMLTKLFDVVMDDDRLVFCFAGDVPTKIFRPYRSLLDKGRVINFGVVSPEDALSLVQQSDIALQLNAAMVPYLLSTKVYEYAAIKKPILSINGGGEIDSLLLENQWGVSIHYKDKIFSEKIKYFIDEFKTNKQFLFVERYSYRFIAEQYSQLIQEI